MSVYVVAGIIVGAIALYDFFLVRPARRAVKDYFGYRFWKR